MVDATEKDLESLKIHLQSVVDAHNVQVERGQAPAFSLDVIRVEANGTRSMETLLSQADEVMYKLSRRRTAA